MASTGGSITLSVQQLYERQMLQHDSFPSCVSLKREERKSFVTLLPRPFISGPLIRFLSRFVHFADDISLRRSLLERKERMNSPHAASSRTWLFTFEGARSRLRIADKVFCNAKAPEARISKANALYILHIRT